MPGLQSHRSPQNYAAAAGLGGVSRRETEPIAIRARASYRAGRTQAKDRAKAAAFASQIKGGDECWHYVAVLSV